MKRETKGRGSLRGMAVWSLLIIGGVLLLFIRLLFGKWRGEVKTLEEHLLLVGLGIFLLLYGKEVWKNGKALYRSYRPNPEEESFSEDVSEKKYVFFEMYRKLSIRRLGLLLGFPFVCLICLLSVMVFVYGENLGGGIRTIVLRFFSVFSPVLVALLFLPPLLLFFKTALSKTKNEKMLLEVYERATAEEIAALDAIGEKEAGHVFTEDYLINWDGALNIIPLKEIRTLRYISYYYLLLHGTKLKITGVEKYVLWNHGPTSEEWIERGFPLPKDKKQSVEMNIST